MSVAQLRRTMSERELQQWARYRSQRMFPWRRLELQIAMLSLTFARVNGNTGLTIDDFLFDPKPEAPKMTAKKAASILSSLSGTHRHGVHVLGQGRKKKAG